MTTGTPLARPIMVPHRLDPNLWLCMTSKRSRRRRAARPAKRWTCQRERRPSSTLGMPSSLRRARPAGLASQVEQTQGSKRWRGRLLASPRANRSAPPLVPARSITVSTFSRRPLMPTRMASGYAAPARPARNLLAVIISKTPLRVSFVGGGSDLPEFYAEHGGAVISTAIDKWIHVIVAKRFEGDIRVSYSRTEIVDSAKDVEHELVRESLALTGLPRSLDIVTLADVPTQGTGLGSSSAVTVGLLNALYAYQGIYKSAAELAAEAVHIELGVLAKGVGLQD